MFKGEKFIVFSDIYLVGMYNVLNIMVVLGICF